MEEYNMLAYRTLVKSGKNSIVQNIQKMFYLYDNTIGFADNIEDEPFWKFLALFDVPYNYIGYRQSSTNLPLNIFEKLVATSNHNQYTFRMNTDDNIAQIPHLYLKIDSYEIIEMDFASKLTNTQVSHIAQGCLTELLDQYLTTLKTAESKKMYGFEKKYAQFCIDRYNLQISILKSLHKSNELLYQKK